MATSRPFAYNTGSTINGTEQVGSLAVGTPTAGFAATGLRWWNGPDEDLGYVIAQSVSANTQPTPIDGVTASVGFFRSDKMTEASFIQIAQLISINQVFASGSAAKTWLNNNGYWTSYTANTSVTFSQNFIFNQAPTTSVENAWTSFRQSLTGSYTTMTLSSSLGTTITVTDATKVQDIANALRTATTGTDTTVVIGTNTWRIAHGCVAGTANANSIYLTTGSLCACGGTYTIRPMIKNANWGGLAGSSCGQPTQVLTLTFS